jgi:hypothetical protein
MAGTTTGTSGASGGLASAGIGAVSSIATSLISSSFAKKDAKKQRELIDELGRLDLAQQKELEIRLQDVKGELAKQEMIYKYIAVQKNDEALAKIKSKRYTSYMVLGGAVVGLTIVIILLAKKKNG